MGKGREMPTGFYPAMPAETYYPSHHVGSSLVKLLQPEYEGLDFWDASWMNPNAPKPEDERSEALHYGNAMHMLVLEPDRFHASFAIKKGVQDSTVPGCIGEGQYKQMLTMRERLLSKVSLSTLLKGGQAEVSMFWKHSETGTPCRGRLDFLKDYSVVDLKFVQRVSRAHIPIWIAKYGYDVQAAMFLDGLKTVGGSKFTPHFTFIFQEKVRPYKVRAVTLDDDVIAEGRSKYEAAMRRYQEFYEQYGTTPWPDFADQVENLNGADMPRSWSGSQNVI